MGYTQGSIVVARAPFRGGRRPYLVVSNDRRPFQGEEYTVATVTTTARSAAIEIAAADLAEGQLARHPSYVNPWSLHVVQHDGIEKRIAHVGGDRLRDVTEAVRTFVEPT